MSHAPHHDADLTDADSQRRLRPEEQDPSLWKGSGWTARIIKNGDDDGWAVEMTRDGELEPALVGPWTMGRDKKNPKPIDVSAFATLVKGANEVRMRHQQQLRAQLHRSVTIEVDGQYLRVDLDIAPDEDDPHAILTVHHASGATRSSDSLRKARDGMWSGSNDKQRAPNDVRAELLPEATEHQSRHRAGHRMSVLDSKSPRFSSLG